MEDQYGMADLRQYIDGRPFFPAISQSPEMLSFHRGLTSPQPYDMLMFRPSSPTAGFEAESAGLITGGEGRWPRQETLTLLEIRSRLDPKFKVANHKGPLWDEVSWIMSEENGYQRSGKKCREKFENLYKYYKKTKEGKAGRQDGKHYRFFRQLEALYGDTTHFHGGNFPNSLPSDQEACPGSKISDTSLPDSADYDTTSTYCSGSDGRLLDSSANNDDSREKKRWVKRSLKAKIEESINAQMKNMMEKQEVWMERMTRAMESKERERVMREEQWRKQDAERIEREHEMWASERARIEARDVALLDAFNKLSGKDGDVLPESEASRLVQLRSGMDSRCREKWDEIINDYAFAMKYTKKRKDNTKCSYTYTSPFLDHQVGGDEDNHGYENEPLNDGYLVGDSYQRL